MGDDLGKLSVVIADDEPVIRSALADLISSDAGLLLVGTANDADGAISLARKHQPDVVVLDVKMPAGGGERAAREIRSSCPATRIIALSAHDDRSSVLEMLRAGASGYVVKGASSGDILEALRRSIRGQASLSAEVTGDVIHELVDLLNRSEEMSRDLRELDNTKRDLIQLLSHELMTPITVVQGATATMRSLGNRIEPEDAEALADSVARATDRLRRLVGNLSVTAKLDRDDVEVETRPIRAATIVEMALREFPGQEDRLRADIPPSLEVWADSDLAPRALVLLIENALDASADGLPIEITTTEDRGDVRFDVSDRGHGVPEEIRDQIFGAFVQAERGNTRSRQGVGIGLYLAARILTAHRGRMETHPRSGGGSTFSVFLPAATSSDAAN
ncbi:MAG: ATP-binding response regulator [Actinomycetota bacterium]